MCGIIGAIGTLPKKKKFEEARDTLAHRGPDDAGIYYCAEEKAALGHRRLSIIDLSAAGHQPFISNDGRFVLVYNGEIYNYLEIKKEIGGRYDWKTETDTEALLASYILWGEDSLEKFNGMFSFAIWDRKKKTLFCARDRLGVKPFFYFIRNGSFYFASEIKALLSLGILRKPNERIIFDYLYHGIYDHTEDTFFKDVKRLGAGRALFWKQGSVTTKKYWDLAECGRESARLTDKKALERFEELLTDSINLRFRSDVPVGIGLSSGLDSNTLFHYAKNKLGKEMMVFSECAASDEYNECPIIKETLSPKERGAWHTSSLEPGEVLGLADILNVSQGEPYGGVPSIAMFKRCETIRKNGAIVLLEGEGLDEILGGYKYYALDVRKDEKSWNRNTESSLSYSQDMTVLIPRNILDKKFVTTHGTASLQFREPFRSHLLNAQYRDIVHTKIPRVLRFKDHISMAHGIEVRVPYLDYRLVEFCFFLPVRFKIRNGVHKVLVRDVMRRFVPKTVLARPKKTFSAIQIEWFRKHHKKHILSLISSSSFRARGYWNARALIAEAEGFFSGAGDNSFFLWQCINLELWFRQFID